MPQQMGNSNMMGNHGGNQQGMNQQQMQMMRMRMQQQGMMRSGEPMPNMMPNGSGMEMMGPNGMMMRGGLGPGGPQAGMMGGMGPRQPGMMQGNGGMMGPGINMAGGPGMLGPGHPAMQHHGMQASRPPPPEYGMSSQGQNMPYNMMGGPGMGPGGMRLQGPPVRGQQGLQQHQSIPPSGPMMRHQNPLGDAKMRMPQQQRG